ncbi:hypothetical protein ABZT47_05720 [Sphaerisporangium sp. NPDC005289]|uniref:hypothetical protein n=1 Tax=Sphaerisporangium sp. NPDC005289 TaxID=3155247 RepID=UPI0033B875AA
MSSESAPSGTADPELIIVADPEDEVAIEVAEFVTESGHEARVLDVFDAAQMFTVSVRDGVATVTPECPLVLRLPPPPPLRVSFDAEFQYGECLAQLWAVAALTPAPVINRPTPQGLGSRVSVSAALTELRAGVSGGSVEVFAGAPPAPAPTPPPAGEDAEATWWVRDEGTGATAPWTDAMTAEGPFRARWSDADPVFEGVVVLGGNAWRCTTADLDDLDLTERSIGIVARLGLDLAAVTWRLAPDLASARLVNVEPFPALEQLRMVWLGLGPHLVKALFP